MIQNPDKLECPWCFNETDFTIIGIEKVYPKELENKPRPNLNWNVLVRCNQCISGTLYFFTDYKWRRTIEQYVKKMIISQKIGREKQRKLL